MSKQNPHILHQLGGLLDGDLALHDRLVHVQPPHDAREVVQLLRADLGVAQDRAGDGVPRRPARRRHRARQRVAAADARQRLQRVDALGRRRSGCRGAAGWCAILQSRRRGGEAAVRAGWAAASGAACAAAAAAAVEATAEAAGSAAAVLAAGMRLRGRLVAGGDRAEAEKAGVRGRARIEQAQVCQQLRDGGSAGAMLQAGQGRCAFSCDEAV